MFVPIRDENPTRYISFAWVTTGLIILNVAIFALQLTLPEAQQINIFLEYGLTPAAMAAGDPGPSLAGFLPVSDAGAVQAPIETTLLTHMFIHGNAVHLITNMMFLWVFGDNVEDAMGHLPFLVFYLACGAIAAIAHMTAAPDSLSPMIGASGAASGILGAYLLLYPRAKVRIFPLLRVPIFLSLSFLFFSVPTFAVVLVWIAAQVAVFLVQQDSPIAFAAHIGGFAAGLVLVLLFRRKGVGLFNRVEAEEPRPAAN